MQNKITMKDYNRISKLQLIEENQGLKEKLASVCIPIGISGHEAREKTPQELQVIAEHRALPF